MGCRGLLPSVAPCGRALKILSKNFLGSPVVLAVVEKP
jgi:hypothetical protein